LGGLIENINFLCAGPSQGRMGEIRFSQSILCI
jgi:hypothetical protein